MNPQALHESLSAAMDNEADELELRRVLAASQDPQARATWARYQLARAALHRELLEPRLDLSLAVAAALDAEQAPAPRRRLPLAMLGRVAVAASVTLAVLVGVRFYNDSASGDAAAGRLAASQALPASSLPQLQEPAVLAGYSLQEAPSQQARAAVPGASQWHQQRLPDYLRQHAREAALNEGPLPYARAASLEDR
jgi:sigma-E factor negative regulatory protein RseA